MNSDQETQEKSLNMKGKGGFRAASFVYGKLGSWGLGSSIIARKH